MGTYPSPRTSHCIGISAAMLLKMFYVPYREYGAQFWRAWYGRYLRYWGGDERGSDLKSEKIFQLQFHYSQTLHAAGVPHEIRHQE